MADQGNDGEKSVSFNQKVIHDCMSQQKKLFETLYSTSRAHLNTCHGLNVETNSVHGFIEKYISVFQRSKESVDYYLLNGSSVSVTTPAACSVPFLVAKEIEQLVMQKFQEIDDFKEHLQEFSERDVDRRLGKEPLSDCFGDILVKAKVIMDVFYPILGKTNRPSSGSTEEVFPDTLSTCEGLFFESFNKNMKQIKDVFQGLLSSNGLTLTEGCRVWSFTQWKILIGSSLANLRLNLLCKELEKTISFAGDLIGFARYKQPDLCFKIHTCLNYLCVLVDLIKTLGEGLLKEFLAMHRIIAEITQVLAYAFPSIYRTGFGPQRPRPYEDSKDLTFEEIMALGDGSRLIM